MLVVITIIGILASLGTVAVFHALKAAKQARIQAEIIQIASAVEQYKQKYGDYPPSDMSNVTLIKQHLGKLWGRCDPVLEINSIPMANGSYVTPYTGSGAVMSPAQAIVFWLTSISKDPVHPLSAKTTDRSSLFDFDKARLDSTAATSSPAPKAPGWYLDAASGTYRYVPTVYMPQSGNGAPYAYFDSRSYYFVTPGTPPTYKPVSYTAAQMGGTSSASGTVMPYLINNSSLSGTPAITYDSFVNPKSFQIISAGLDGNYGGAGTTIAPTVSTNPTMTTAKLYATGTGYDNDGEADNMTNFSDKALGDAKP